MKMHKEGSLSKSEMEELARKKNENSMDTESLLKIKNELSKTC